MDNKIQPTPNLSPIEHLRRFYSNRILPQVYDDSLSFQELLYGVLAKMNEVITKVNSFDELIEYVEKELNSLNETIKATVLEQLEIWYNDGTLKDILESVSKEYFETLKEEIDKEISNFEMETDEKIEELKDVDKELDEKINGLKDTMKFVPYLSLQRTMRHFYVTGYNNYKYNSDTFQGYAFPQGYCTLIKNNTRYHISSNPADHHINTGMIRVYKNGSNDMCASVVIPMGHANSMCYNEKDGYIYIAWCMEYDLTTGTSGVSKRITRILLVDLLNSNDTFQVKEFPSTFASISVDNGQLYGLQHSELRLYKLDWENATETASIFLNYNCTYNPIGIRLQGHTMDKNYIYMLDSYPSTITVFDKQTGNYVWKFDLPYTVNNRWELGEAEDLTVDDDGTLWLQTTDHISPNEYNCYDHQQIFICNLYKNDTYESDMNDFKSSNVFLIHCNPKLPNVNPTGSASEPFNIIQEAINYANICPAPRVQIKIDNDGDDGFNVINTTKTLYIYGSSNDNYINVGGFLILGGNVVIKNLDIFNCATKSSCKVAGIYCEKCNCWVDGVNIVPYSSTFRSKSNTISCGFYASCTNGSYWSNTLEADWNKAYSGIPFTNIVNHSCNIVVGSGA